MNIANLTNDITPSVDASFHLVHAPYPTVNRTGTGPARWATVARSQDKAGSDEQASCMRWSASNCVTTVCIKMVATRSPGQWCVPCEKVHTDGTVDSKNRRG